MVSSFSFRDCCSDPKVFRLESSNHKVIQFFFNLVLDLFYNVIDLWGSPLLTVCSFEMLGIKVLNGRVLGIPFFIPCKIIAAKR